MWIVAWRHSSGIPCDDVRRREEAGLHRFEGVAAPVVGIHLVGGLPHREAVDEHPEARIEWLDGGARGISSRVIGARALRR